MKTKISMTCILLTLALLMTACGGGGASKPTTATTTTNAANPSNTNSNTTTKAVTAKKDDKPKPTEKLKDEKKPAGTAKTANKKVPVPANWIYVYDENKGYGFSLPEGSTGGSETQDGVDTFIAATPAPSEASVVVIAFKDKKMTKEDLMNVAVKFLEGMGEKVQPAKLTAESEEYSVAEVTSATAEGAKSKFKVLVGTDVTDNYVMLVGTDEAKFDAHKDIIDAIWGSFEMWSGGADSDS